MEAGEIATGNSNWQGDAYLVDLIHLYRPDTIYDFGVGKWAKIGYLVRKNYQDFRMIQGVLSKQLILVGIEGHLPNWDMANRSGIYDYLFYEKIEEFVVKDAPDWRYTGRIDVAVFGDVLEHFELKTAKMIVEKVKKRCTKAIIVQMPLGEYKQEVEINPLENHRSTWTFEEIQSLDPAGLRKFTDNVGREFVVFAIPV